MLDFDIGLIPLADSVFSSAKSNLKGMEYNAMGIPYIATPSEPYRSYTLEGDNGLLAKTPDEWRNHLELLVSEHGLRKSMGVAAREIAYTQSIQEHYRQWGDVWTA